MRRSGVRLLLVAMLLISTVLPAATKAVAQSDRVGVPLAEDCTGEVATATEIIDSLREGNARPADPDAVPMIGIEEDELPAGGEPDPDDLDAATAALWSTVACVNAGDFARFFGALTPAGLHALVSGLFDALGRPPGPFTEEELSGLETNLTAGLQEEPQSLFGDDQARIEAIRGARLLEDGRILLLADGKIILDGTGYVILVEVEGVWKIDRLGQLGDVDMLGLSSAGDTENDTPTVVVVDETPEVITETPGAGVTTTSGSTEPIPESVLIDTIRTLAYHEITKWESTPNARVEEAPIISDNGNLIAFTRSPGSGDPEDPNRVFVMGIDGQNEREIDAYTPLCYCASLIDLSADGSIVVASDSTQIRVASANGSSGQLLLALASNEINAIRISGDGSTIVFRIYRDTTVKDSSETLSHGLYAMNADGTNLRQLAGAVEFAVAFDVPIELVPAAGPQNSLDVSYDGQSVVAAVFVDPQPGGVNQGVIRIDGDGDPQVMMEPEAFVLNVAISGDGSTAAAVYVDLETNNTVAAMLGEGSEPRVLTDSSNVAPGIGQGLTGSGERIQLTADGTLLLLGGTGLLVNTANGHMIALAMTDRSAFNGDPPQVVQSRLEFATMDGTASTVIYLTPDAATIWQLVRLDINPADLGEAPSITETTLNVQSIGLNQVDPGTVTARVVSDSDYLRVGVVAYRDGRADDNVAYSGTPLFDDGATNGDVVAQDGVFTTNAIGADCCAAPGPRTLRVKAETIDANGFRHATAIDGGEFEVRE